MYLSVLYFQLRFVVHVNVYTVKYTVMVIVFCLFVVFLLRLNGFDWLGF